ncbi:MAG TPA: hypothetical protein VK524_20720 [Polyangiaceae bacterium]|nr:hypothetical protein [Polyangiaceae bacterium]
MNLKVLLHVSLSVVALQACVDTSPIVVNESKDASVQPDAGTVAACLACVTGDGAPCRAAYDGCVAAPKCVDFIECAFELHCFALLALEDRIRCGEPCLRRFSIGSTDPAIGPILLLNTCSQTSCGKECVIE